jgi:hypothetical protein
MTKEAGDKDSMADEQNQNNTSPENPENSEHDENKQDTQPENNQNNENDMDERLERLGGEPAPVITPEEFARLQRAGQVHIDASGRVRTARRRDEDDGGVSLRKRRAWY